MGQHLGSRAMAVLGGLLSNSYWFKFTADISHTMNNKVELSAIQMIMHLAIHLNIKRIQIFGDTKLVVDWINH